MSEAQSRVGFFYWSRGHGAPDGPAFAAGRLAGSDENAAAVSWMPSSLEGLHPADSPAEVARGTAGGVIFLMLTDSPAVETVVLGESGLISGLSPGTLVIDMSTTALMLPNAVPRRWAGRGWALGGCPGLRRGRSGRRK